MIPYYHTFITVNISSNYLTWDSNNSLHYIRMQEYRLAEIYYICILLICILFYTHKH